MMRPEPKTFETDLSRRDKTIAVSQAYPLVSIIIPAFNHESWIDAALDSVLVQSFTDFELIVVDDGSQDQTPKLVAARDDPRLKLVRQENRGTAAALNRGLDLARGQYISILNSDDQYAADRLSVMVEKLESNPQYCIAFSRVGLIDSHGCHLPADSCAQIWLDKGEAAYWQSGDLLASLLRDNFLCTSSNFFFRRSLLCKIGLFRDFRYVNDLDFLLRALQHGRGWFCDRELLLYRIHDGGTLKEKEHSGQAEFLLEVSLVLALALETDGLVRKWDFQDLVELLATYYRLNLESILFAILYLKFSGSGLYGISSLSPAIRSCLLHECRRRLAEQKYQNSLLESIEEYKQHIEKLCEARDYHLQQSEVFQQLELDHRRKIATLQQKQYELQELLRLRDLELARNERLQSEIWQAREWYRERYEELLGSRKYRLLSWLSNLFHLRISREMPRELVRILLPEQWLLWIRSAKYKLVPSSVQKNVRTFFLEKAAEYYNRLFNAYVFLQKPSRENLVSVILEVPSLEMAKPVIARYLQKQSWPDFELLCLVTKTEKEGRAATLSSEIRKGSGNVFWLQRHPQETLAELRNRGLAEVSGKYVFMLDYRDRLPTTMIEMSLMQLESAPPKSCIILPGVGFDSGRDWQTSEWYKAEFLGKMVARVLVFPRRSATKIGGFRTVLSDFWGEQDFFLRLLRDGFTGYATPFHRSSFFLRSPGLNGNNNNNGLSQLRKLHESWLLRHEKRLAKRVRRFWRIKNWQINLAVFRRQNAGALWLDLRPTSVPSPSFFPRLLARPADSEPLVVVADIQYERFFQFNYHPAIYAYIFPEKSRGIKSGVDFYAYLREYWQSRPVTPEALAREVKKARRDKRLRILYAAPWLITGGADTMTVDWFQCLGDEWCEKFLVTTLRRDNVWLEKVVPYAAGIYELPQLGVEKQSDITAWFCDFIDLWQIDILHIMNSEAAFVALPVLKERFPRLRVVVQFHCFDYLSDGRPAGYVVQVPSRYDHLIDRYNLEYRRLGEEIRALYPYVALKKIAVIHGRINCNYYDPGRRLPMPEIAEVRRRDVLNLLFIGRLDRQKRPLRLLAVAAALRELGINFYLHVVGDGNLESQRNIFLQEIQRQKLENVVGWHGEQPAENLFDWYAISDVLLLTSDWEGVPMVLYQALAMQVVPVVADVGGCSELVTPECGFLIADPAKIEMYVEAVSSLQDAGLRRKMGLAGRQRMLSNFALSGLEAEYRRLYSELRPKSYV